MRVELAERIDRLIDRYELHGPQRTTTGKIKLDALHQMFRPKWLDLFPGLIGMCMLPAEGEISEVNFARIILSRQLREPRTSVVYAHEIGHALAGHERALWMDAFDNWLLRKTEREAWEVAARLLIPPAAIMEHGSRDRIAAACEVPAWILNYVY